MGVAAALPERAKVRPPTACGRALNASVLLSLGLRADVPILYLASYDRDISSSTRAIETARDDSHRAAGIYNMTVVYSRNDCVKLIDRAATVVGGIP